MINTAGPVIGPLYSEIFELGLLAEINSPTTGSNHCILPTPATHGLLHYPHQTDR